MNRFLFIGSIIGIILISGCVQETGPSNPCEWVFKTDPTNIGHLMVSTNIDLNNVSISSFRVFNATQLNNGYFTITDSCLLHEENLLQYHTLKPTSLEELKEYNISYGKVDGDALFAAIKDRTPWRTSSNGFYSNIYICDIGHSTDLYERYIRECEPNSDFTCILNKIIDSNELDTMCRKIIFSY